MIHKGECTKNLMDKRIVSLEKMNSLVAQEQKISWSV